MLNYSKSKPLFILAMTIDAPNTAIKTHKLKKIKQSFTSLLISNLLCPYGKAQALYWDKDTPNLGLRITENGSKAFIFEASLNNNTIRITIGNVTNCSIEEARARVIKLKSLVNQGIDPRKLANKKVANFISAKDLAITRKAQSATLHSAWLEYITAHENKWSARRQQRHLKLISATSNKLAHTLNSVESLADIKLTELSIPKISEWVEAFISKDQLNTQYTVKLLKAFFAWCNTHEAYQEVISNQFMQEMVNLIKTITPHEKPMYLSNNQLSHWFNAVNQIHNNEISTYLKVLLLTGRREAEIANLQWSDINFDALTISISNNEESHLIPLTPHVASLLNNIANDESRIFNNLTNLSHAHKLACKNAGLSLSISALRTSFTLFSEWVETPTGITAQIQDIDIKGISAHHFIERPIELLQKWHNKIEAWILEQVAV